MGEKIKLGYKIVFELSVYNMHMLRQLVKPKRYCKYFITLLILLNAVIAGLLTIESFKNEYGYVLNLICDISVIVFLVEISIRIWLGKRNFWIGKNWRWNIFDLLITVVSSISLIVMSNSLITLRIFREFRVLRVFSRFKNLRVILDAMIDSFSKLAWTGVLFVVFYYLYAVLGVDFFRKDNPEYFENIGVATFTLFQIMTLDDWNIITKNVMKTYPLAWTYFLSFVLIVSYILLNFIVGIIISSLGQMIDKERHETINQIKEDIEDIKKLIQNNS